MNSNFSILLHREVYDFLNGDVDLCTLKGKQIQMPRLSGPQLIDLLHRFGVADVEAKKSRWQYMEQLLQHTNKHKKTSELFVFLFDLSRFKEVIPSEYSPDEVLQAHRNLVDLALNKINAYLVYSGKELRKDSSHFYLVDKKNTAVVSSTQLQRIDMAYIHNLTSRIQSELDSGNFDEVLTKSRTLAEEVLIHILEDKQEINIPKGDWVELTKKVKAYLNMQQRHDFDRRINAMLSGLEKIMQAVVEMRNAQGDAHGQGSKRINIRKYEAMLVVNSTITYLDYIFSVYLNQKEQTPF